MTSAIQKNPALASLMGTTTTTATTATSATGATGATGAGDSTRSTVEQTQDRFMKLLVAQLQNQDPLNPLDNAQVTSQMAQLSTVTGIDKLNSSMESIMSTFTSGQQLQTANMIGHSVLVPGHTVTLAGGGVNFGAELAGTADRVKIAISDANGNVVRQIDAGTSTGGMMALSWDGKTDSGATAANGAYTFKVSASLGKDSVAATALAVGKVSSVSTSAQGAKLEVSGLGTYGVSDVRQIL